MSKVTSLGHVGITVQDLDMMTDFYTRILGFTPTDDIKGSGVFLSAHPETEHHEVVLSKGETHTNAQQISLTVGSLDDLRDLYNAVKDYGCTDFRVTNHGIALGCYFNDPEQNNVEIYWSTGFDYPQPFATMDLDLNDSNEVLMEMLENMAPIPGSEQHYYGKDVGKRLPASV